MIEKIIGLCRAYPLITTFSLLISYFVTNDTDVLMFIIFLLISDIFNHIFKHYVMEPIMGKRNWPILGTGTRPKGAKHCSLFKSSGNGKPTSYGMPSGHSQNAVLFSSYIIGNLINNDFNYVIKVGGIFIFSVIPLIVMYSRVHFKCHTVQQVIIGGLIGAGLGSLYFNNKNKILNFVKTQI
jgi:membrane-associated phospholipid phosphatase